MHWLTDLLTRPHGTRETPGTLSEAFAWSARRAGTWETGETRVVWLITQRSRVQIPPRYQGQRPSFEQEEGLWREICKLTL